MPVYSYLRPSKRGAGCGQYSFEVESQGFYKMSEPSLLMSGSEEEEPFTTLHVATECLAT